jgi:hypothetical protein
MRKLLAGLVLAGAVTATVAVALPAHADTIDGNGAASAYWYPQPGNDCEEASANIVYGLMTGARMRAATIDAEAVRLGIYYPATGSAWWLLPELLAHYHIASTQGSHSVATLEADLAAGDHVIAQVNAETIWHAEGLTFTNAQTGPDHALVVDAVDVSQGTVWLTDTGRQGGALDAVPMSVFRQAWSTSNYSITVVKA